jgi:hypothetical protein
MWANGLISAAQNVVAGVKQLVVRPFVRFSRVVNLGETTSKRIVLCIFVTHLQISANGVVAGEADQVRNNHRSSETFR